MKVQFIENESAKLAGAIEELEHRVSCLEQSIDKLDELLLERQMLSTGVRRS